MKICPQCRKSYEDNNLNFCLDDGTALIVSDQAAPTVMLPSQGETVTQQAAAPTQWQQPPIMQQAQPPRKSKTWVWVLLIVGVLLLVCGGGIGGIFLVGYNRYNEVVANIKEAFPSPSAMPSGSSTPAKTNKNDAKTDDYLTLANYKRLKTGMTRAEVETILGGKGSEISSSNAAGYRFSVDQWQGDNFKSIILTFQNDKIFSKTQYGLGSDDDE